MATQEFGRSLPMMLYRALDVVMPRFRMIFKEFGLTEQQWRVLRVLWEHKNVPFHELVGMTLIPAPSLVGVIDRLSRNGLVARRRSKSDRRQVSVYATEMGCDLEEKVRPRVEQAYAELRTAIDTTKWQQLIDGLEQLTQVGIDRPETAKVVRQQHQQHEGA